jgi:hypothetical protein
MEMNVEITKIMRISRQHSQRSKTARECGLFQYLAGKITNDARCAREIRASLATANVTFDKNKIPFPIKLYLNLRKKLVKCFMWNLTFMMLRFEHIRNPLKVLKLVLEKDEEGQLNQSREK